MTTETKVAEQITLLWDYTINKGFPFLANSNQVPALRALLEGEKLEDQPTFEWLKETLHDEDDETVTTSVNTEDTLRAEIDKLLNEKKEFNSKLAALKGELEDSKLAGYALNQSYIEGVDEGIDKAINLIDETFSSEEN